MIRDPRDVVLSTANYVMEKEHGYSPYFSKLSLSLSESINRIITGIDGPIQSYQPKNPKIPSVESFHHDMQGGIFETYKRFTRWEQTENILIVKFEDLVGSKGGGNIKKQKEIIRKISSFSSIQLSDINIGKIVNSLFGGTSTFRKGRIGSWESLFTETNKHTFKNNTGNLLIDLGYEKDNNW
jgi:sulfotransferase 6B1